MKLALFRTVALLVMICGATSATIARRPPPPKRFGVIIRPDGIEYRPSCKGTEPYEDCKVYTSLPAPHPRLLRRHGVVYGVQDIAYHRGCVGVPPEDACEVYKVSGSIVSVWRHPDTRRVEGFMLRMRNGRTKLQNIDPDYLPVAAEPLIRRGRRVRVSGAMEGQGRVAAPDEIIAEPGR